MSSGTESRLNVEEKKPYNEPKIDNKYVRGNQADLLRRKIQNRKDEERRQLLRLQKNQKLKAEQERIRRMKMKKNIT